MSRLSELTRRRVLERLAAEIALDPRVRVAIDGPDAADAILWNDDPARPRLLLREGVRQPGA